jgi:hypothetical protein
MKVVWYLNPTEHTSHFIFLRYLMLGGQMSEERRSFFGEEVGADGSVWDLQIWVCADAEMDYYSGQYVRDMELEELRKATDNFDPNTCDSRRVRREFDRDWINLGMKASRIASNARRI